MIMISPVLQGSEHTDVGIPLDPRSTSSLVVISSDGDDDDDGGDGDDEDEAAVSKGGSDTGVEKVAWVREAGVTGEEGGEEGVDSP